MAAKAIKIFLLVITIGVFGAAFYLTATETQNKETGSANVRVLNKPRAETAEKLNAEIEVKTEPIKKESPPATAENQLPKTKPPIISSVISPVSNSPNITESLVSWGHETPLSDRTIDTIIVHSSYDALGPDPDSAGGVIYEYQIYGVSPHYLIDRNGSIFRLVKEADIAYHAGAGKMIDGRTNINNFSIGIEIINTKTVAPNSVQYFSLAELVKFLKRKYDIKNILGHSDIAPGRKTDPWNFDWQKFNEMLYK